MDGLFEQKTFEMRRPGRQSLPYREGMARPWGGIGLPFCRMSRMKWKWREALETDFQNLDFIPSPIGKLGSVFIINATVCV